MGEDLGSGVARSLVSGLDGIVDTPDRAVGPTRRDRRGRGLRGPALGRGPLAPRGVPAQQSRAERFDAIALSVVRDVESRWPDALARLEVAVEEIPLLADEWDGPVMPLATLVEPTARTAPRLVLFRRPLEHRAPSRSDLEALLLTVVVEELAGLVGVAPEDLHPDYDPGDDDR